MLYNFHIIPQNIFVFFIISIYNIIIVIIIIIIIIIIQRDLLKASKILLTNIFYILENNFKNFPRILL